MKVDNLIYKRINNQFVVFSEWSLLPLEIFNHEQEAKDYITGFRRKPITERTEAYLKGLEYRNWIDIDVKEGWKFKRYNILDEVMESVY